MYFISKIFIPFLYVGSFIIIFLYMIFISILFLFTTIMTFWFKNKSLIETQNKLISLLPQPIPPHKMVIDKNEYDNLMNDKLKEYFKHLRNKQKLADIKNN